MLCHARLGIPLLVYPTARLRISRKKRGAESPER